MVTLKLSNVVGDFNDESNFLQKLLLTTTQVQSFVKVLQIILQVTQNYQKLTCIK